MLTTVTVTVCTEGRVADVRITAPSDTAFARICRRLRLAPDEVHVDGHRVEPSTPLIDAVAPGAVLTTASGAPVPARSWAGGRRLAVSGGLHAGRAVPFDPGLRVMIGRGSTADLRVPCPTVSPEHAVATWPASGPLLSDGDSTNGIVDATGTRQASSPLDPTGSVRIGAARIRLAVPPDDALTLGRAEAPDARRTVDRPLLPPLSLEGVALPVPSAPTLVAGQSPFSWALFLGPLAVGGTMALLLSPVMAAVALLSPLMMLASWFEGRRRQRRGERREHRRLRGELAAFAVALDALRTQAAARRHADHPDPAEIVRRAHTPARSVWARRPNHPAWLMLRVGTGRVPWRAALGERSSGEPASEVQALLAAADHLVDVPVCLPAADLAVVGLTGHRSVTEAVVRSLVIDAATHQGPADLGIVIDTDRPEAWSWARWLPHHEPLEPATKRHLLVVCDRPGPLRRGTRARSALDRSGGRTTLLVITASGADPPDRCDVVVRALDHLGSATIEATDPRNQATEVLLDGLDLDVAESVARSLAHLRDPEHEPMGGLPAQVRLSELVEVRLDDAAIRERWAVSQAARLELLLGLSASGPREIDLVTAGPHALIGGTTGAGKSELLRTLVAGLAIAHPPDQVTFVLVDYKGGSAFDACADLPHTVGLVTDLDGRLGDRAIRSLEAEIRRREQVLRHSGHEDFATHAGHAPALARLVVVVDEFAALARDLPEVLDALVDVARRGRSLGIHLVLATQRPTGVVSDQIRTNTNLRIALRMIDPGDSADVIGDGSATALPSGVPGRAVIREGAHVEEVQVACVSLPAQPTEIQVRWLDPSLPGDDRETTPAHAPGPTDLADIVAASGAAWAACTSESPVRSQALRRPWLEPLPLQVELSDHTADEACEPTAAWTIGVADDPDGQRRVPVQWHPDEGPLLVFGLPGSGCTTTLRTVVRSAARHLEPSQLHVYVVGSPAEWTPSVGHLPHLGRVIEPDDGVRLDRLLDLARHTRDARDRDPALRLLIVLDDLAHVLEAIDRVGGVGLVDEVISLLSRPAPGLAVAASADRVGAAPGALSAISRKLCLRLPDPYDYAAFGLRPVDLRGLPAGRGFDVSTGLEVQVFQAERCAHRVGSGSATASPDPLDVLPPVLHHDDIGPTPPERDGRWATVLGLADHPRLPAVIELDRGDHMLVAGPSGSGRSTALAALAARSGACIITGAARSPLRAGPATARLWCPLVDLDLARWRDDPRPRALLIDDADLLDDPDGTLARLLDDPGSLRVIAAVHNERIRSRYQHWTARLAAGRMGLALRPRPQDADLWATTFPTRPTTDWPPGRGYLVEHGRADLVQVVLP